jgi:hypothetical protein
MATRKDRVAPPPAAAGWDFRFATTDAAKGWEERCRSAGPNARTAWDRITSDPRRRDAGQHPLKGALDRRAVNGVELEQWQYEATAGGRIWYVIDDRFRTIWMTHAGTGHPKATE